MPKPTAPSARSSGVGEPDQAPGFSASHLLGGPAAARRSPPFFKSVGYEDAFLHAFRGIWFALPAAMMFGGTDLGRPGLPTEIRPDRLRQPDWLTAS